MSEGDFEIPLIESEQIMALASSAGVEMARTILDAFWTSNDELLTAIARHLSTGDLDELRKSAHALKGSAANLGATRVSETARKIEYGARDNDLESVKNGFISLPVLIEDTRQGFENLLERLG